SAGAGVIGVASAGSYSMKMQNQLNMLIKEFGENGTKKKAKDDMKNQMKILAQEMQAAGGGAAALEVET
ncbi:hypothetical protein N8083_01930, partial [Candidatus Pacebacteria bacterium]|nr:hypothetical protein [Candidatus Paceibacterota bacterium]